MLIPLVAGSLRVFEVAGGPQLLPTNPWVDASPAPLVLHVAGAAVYVYKYGNPFKNIAEVKHSAGARFISFEGDVRVIRAATRENIPANSDTELYPGDTVQTQASGRAPAPPSGPACRVPPPR